MNRLEGQSTNFLKNWNQFLPQTATHTDVLIFFLEPIDTNLSQGPACFRVVYRQQSGLNEALHYSGWWSDQYRYRSHLIRSVENRGRRPTFSFFLLAFQWENLFSFKCSIIPPFSSWKRRRIREFRSSFYSSLRKMIQWIRSSGPSERSDAFFKKKLKQSMTSFHNQSHDVNRRTFWVFINISGWTLLFDSTDFI